MNRRASHARQHGRDAATDAHRHVSRGDRITPFERSILRLIASGKHRSEIAEKLNRSPQTISNALTIAKDKLGARSLAEAAALVARDESDGST